MKLKIILTEIFSTTIALAGVIVLVGTFFPLINPTQYWKNAKSSEVSPYRYYYGVVGASVAFASAWFLNKRAIKARGRNNKPT
ncbi:MAG: hypothetical protein WCK77_24605 [Verrucomicrobiota bacterium]